MIVHGFAVVSIRISSQPNRESLGTRLLLCSHMFKCRESLYLDGDLPLRMIINQGFLRAREDEVPHPLLLRDIIILLLFCVLSKALLDIFKVELPFVAQLLQ